MTELTKTITDEIIGSARWKCFYKGKKNRMEDQRDFEAMENSMERMREGR